MKARNALFWLVYFILGIWAQRLIPGVDLLAPGILVSLQEGRSSQTLWLAVAAILIQEGMGTLAFGTALLWYLGLGILYLLGRWLFEAKNILFVSLMGLGMGAIHFILLTGMQILQESAPSRPNLLFESLIQALAFPLLWAVLRVLRKEWTPRGDSI